MKDVVYYQLCEELPKSEQLSCYERLGLSELPEGSGESFPFLSFLNGRLCLTEKAGQSANPTCVDFSDPALLYRLQTSGKQQGLAKAVGLNKFTNLRVLDGTAGLGRDSFILAGLGCSVTLLERQPIVHALLEDGFSRVEFDDERVRSVVKKMKLHHADSADWFKSILAGKEEKPDVIYLDPMFPQRQKSARVKKDIASLQHILGVDEDLLKVLALAKRCAKKRIVVKRPTGKTNDLLYSTLKPAFEISGKSVHFDVFLPDSD